jgi:hypothetical protein
MTADNLGHFAPGWRCSLLRRRYFRDLAKVVIPGFYALHAATVEPTRQNGFPQKAPLNLPVLSRDRQNGHVATGASGAVRLARITNDPLRGFLLNSVPNATLKITHFTSKNTLSPIGKRIPPSLIGSEDPDTPGNRGRVHVAHDLMQANRVP